MARTFEVLEKSLRVGGFYFNAALGSGQICSFFGREREGERESKNTFTITLSVTMLVSIRSF